MNGAPCCAGAAAVGDATPPSGRPGGLDFANERLRLKCEECCAAASSASMQTVFKQPTKRFGAWGVFPAGAAGRLRNGELLEPKLTIGERLEPQAAGLTRQTVRTSAAPRTAQSDAGGRAGTCSVRGPDRAADAGHLPPLTRRSQGRPSRRKLPL